MNESNDEKQAYIQKLEARIDEWNAKAKKLRAEQRIEYEVARNNFESRLESWKAALEADWEVTKAKVKEGFRALEMKWNELSKRSK